MSLFTTASLTEAAQDLLTKRGHLFNAAKELANESQNFSASRTYDIFLSHSFLDAKVVFALKSELERHNLSVYVYWVEDPQARETVNAETANRLRHRMRSCKALLYASSQNADKSRWMPWELGYFDGIKQKVAIVPITTTYLIYFEGFKGQEYLDLYPYIAPSTTGTSPMVWKRDRSIITELKRWVDS